MTQEVKLNLWASPYLSVVLIPAGARHGKIDETWGRIGMRRVDAVYLSWLRKNHKGDAESAEKFRQLIETHCPELLKAEAEVPAGYKPPSSITVF